jgi:sarcosine oxidase subunit gamma
MDEARASWVLEADGLSIDERAVSVCVLRLRDPDEALERALGVVFGLTWPSTPNTIAGKTPRVAWLAPREWALFDAAESLETQVARTCGERLHHFADVSAGRRLFRIAGSYRRDLLAKGCSLDTHQSVFTSGRCAQTRLAQIPILLILDGPAFEILVDVSLAGYLRAWLADAALEYQS